MMPDSQAIPTWLDYIQQTVEDLKTETDANRRKTLIQELVNMSVRDEVIAAALQENPHHATHLS